MAFSYGVLLYLVVNLLLAVRTALIFAANPAYSTLGWSLLVSRVAASLLSFHLALILLPVSKTLMSRLRATWLNSVSILSLDDSVDYHKRLGIITGSIGLVHVIAHYRNFFVLSSTDVEELNENLPNLGPLVETPSFLELAFSSVPGWTGHVALGTMLVAFIGALPVVRSKSFEAFQSSHLLFFFTYFALILHGTARVLGSAPVFYLWAASPLIIYLTERLMRTVRTWKPVPDARLQILQSKVIRLSFARPPGFRFAAGQYLHVNVPALSRFEWHPFTISSAPSSSEVDCHIRQVGAWTKGLGALASKSSQPNQPALKIFTDGPFGAPSQDVFGGNHSVLVLIGAGIGVTPFAAILRELSLSIRAFLTGRVVNFPVERCIFHWVCKDDKEFEWLEKLLHDLEDHNTPLLELNVHLTRVAESDKLKKQREDLLRETRNRTLWRARGQKAVNRKDPLTGLKHPVSFGRPNWVEIFADIKARFGSQGLMEHSGDVGVYFCGPSPLSKAIQKAIKQVENPVETSASCTFTYRHERF